MNQSLRHYALNLLALALLLISGSAAWAQDSLLQIRGRILDEKKEALAGASVSLLNSAGKLQTGSTSSANGTFVLRGVQPGNYTLRVSFVGYTTHSQQVRKGKARLALPDIQLTEDGAVLKEVKVAGKQSEIVVKGDTLEFNAGSYTTPQGSAVIELIKKLPGASIDQNGNITVNGKSISQIMVDGKRFFEGDPKAAINNLPAELIEKVQVLDRATDQSRMSGFSDGDDETVINLTIKPGRKKGLFGTAFVGGGTDKRYEGNLTLSRFSDNTQFTILGGLNNTNNAGFTDISQDLSNTGFLWGLQGGGRMGSRRNGPPRWGADGISSTKMLGGNISHTFSPKLTITGNALVGRSDKDKWTRSTQQNFLSAGNTTESGETSERTKRDSYAANFRIEWKPDSLTEVIIQPQLNYGIGRTNYSSQQNVVNDATGAEINASNLLQRTTQEQLSGRLRLDASRRLSASGRTLTLSVNGRFSDGNARGTYLSQLTGTSITGQNLDQWIRSVTNTNELRAKVGWVEPLGRGFFTQLTYQIRTSESHSTRDAYNREGEDYTALDTRYSNDFRSDFLTHQAGVAVKKKGKTYDITAGVNLENSRINSHCIVSGSEIDPISRSTTTVSPTLRWSYKPQKGTELRLDYFGRSFEPTNDQLSPVQDVTNPLVIYKGNQDLAPGFQHNLFGRFNKFWSATQTSLALFGRAQIVQNDIISRSDYNVNTGVRTIDYTNVDGNLSVGIGGFFTQTLPGKKFSLRVGTRNDLSRNTSYINRERNRSLAFRLGEDITLNYRNGGVDMDLRGGFDLYNSSNSLPGVQTTATKDYSLGHTAQITLPLGFTIETEETYTTTRGYSAGFDQDRWLINAGISYSFLKDNRATIRLKGYDLLDSRRSIYREITALSSTTEETNTLGRYVMLHFIYRFDNFGAKGNGGNQRRGPGFPGPRPF